jgi:hypothetical protein
VTGEPTSEQDTMKEMKQCKQVSCECRKENQIGATVYTVNTENAMNTATYRWQDV